MPISTLPGWTGANAEQNGDRPPADLAEVRFQALLEDQTEVIARIRADGTYTYVNEIYCRFFGKTRDELMGGRWQPVAHPDDLPYIQARLATLAPGHPVVEIENRVYSGTGELRWMQFVNRAFFDAAGRLLEIQAVGRDITARKLAETALRDSEEKYRLLFDAMPQGVFVQRADGALIDVNPAALELLGLERGEFLGRNSLTPAWDVVNEDGTPVSADEHPSMVALRDGRGVTNRVLGVFNPRRGDYVWMEVNAIPHFRVGEARPHLAFVTLHDISERKRTEEQIRLQALVLGQIQDTVTVTDLDGRITYVNDAQCKALGRPRADLVGAHVSLYGNDPVAGATQAEVISRTLNEDGWRGEMVNQTGAGGEIVIDLRTRLVRDGYGKPIAMVGLGTDITARRRAEVALREREEKLRSIFRAAPIGIGVIRDRVFQEVNDRFCDMVGYSRDELIGQSSHLVYPGDEEYERVGREKYRQIAERGVGTVETRFRRRDGSIIQVLLSSSPIDSDDLSLGVSFTAQDITESKAKQTELERLTRTERAIGHINQALLHATDEAGFLDEVCRIVVEDCGHAMIWIGIAEQDEGRTVRPIAHAGFEQGYLDKLDITWADDERGRGPTGTAIRTARPSFCRNMVEDDKFGPWRTKALQRGYASSAAFPLLDARGGVFGAISIYSREIDPFTAEETDLLRILAGDLAFGMRTLRLRAEHAEAEATMLALRGEFQQLLEWQVASQTVAAIAHEVGQPLNAVTTFGEAALMLLENISPRPQKLAQAVQGMAVQAERAGHVLRELMQFLRHAEASMESFDLDDLIRCTVALARADRGRIGRITLIGMPDLGPVWGNRLQIEKVLLNLIFNGMDAMRDAGLSGKDAGMTVILARDGDKARVTVSDMGPGIDPMNAQRIFEPFFSSKAKGIGMGLSISRALVEAHGGRLWLDPAPDQGATFHFTVPFAP